MSSGLLLSTSYKIQLMWYWEILENLPSVHHVLKVNIQHGTSSSRNAEEPLGLVHSDLCGKMNENL